MFYRNFQTKTKLIEILKKILENKKDNSTDKQLRNSQSRKKEKPRLYKSNYHSPPIKKRIKKKSYTNKIIISKNSADSNANFEKKIQVIY